MNQLWHFATIRLPCHKAATIQAAGTRCKAGFARRRIIRQCALNTRCLRKQNMRKILLVAALATGMTLAACSETTEDAAEETADSAMADTEANMEAAGDTVDATADAVAEDAAAVEADVQDETVEEAAAD
jgi:hypothetical protein